MNPIDRYGPLPKDKDTLTRRCRLLQSWYRVEVLALRKHLTPPFRDAIRVVSLETAVERGLGVRSPEYEGLLLAFRRRYLDFSPVDALLRRDPRGTGS